MSQVQVLYEDKDIIVAVKPAGMASQPDRSLGMDMVNWLKNAARGDIHVIHRLDRLVGAIMVYARNKKAAASLSRQIRENAVKKEYLAIACGSLTAGVPQEDGSMCLTDFLVPARGKEPARVAGADTPGAVRAQLIYRVIDEKFLDDGSRLCLVRVRLITGRRHQIRAQLAGAGAPILGDGKYGGLPSGTGLALFAWRLGFTHPSTGERMDFKAPIPAVIREHFPENA